MSLEPSRREIAGDLEQSAQLLERLGGRHAHAARFLRERLDGMAASRLAHRDAAILELRTRYFDGLTNNAAAGEIAKMARRYAATRWRRDRAFTEPRASYVGFPDELLFRIVALSGNKLPGSARIRKILDSARVAKIHALESSRHLALTSARDTRSEDLFVDQSAILERLPDYQAAKTHAIEDGIAARRVHVAAIETIDADATKAWPKEEKRKAEAIAKVRRAELDLRTAGAEFNAVAGAVATERHARETARRTHEGALLVGDWSAIDAFVREAQTEYDRTCKAVQWKEIVVRNLVTQRLERQRVGNGHSIKQRCAAIIESIREAPNLRLIADPREIPERLAAMRAKWPPVRDPSDLPAATGVSDTGGFVVAGRP